MKLTVARGKTTRNNRMSECKQTLTNNDSTGEQWGMWQDKHEVNSCKDQPSLLFYGQMFDTVRSLRPEGLEGLAMYSQLGWYGLFPYPRPRPQPLVSIYSLSGLSGEEGYAMALKRTCSGFIVSASADPSPESLSVSRCCCRNAKAAGLRVWSISLLKTRPLFVYAPRMWSNTREHRRLWRTRCVL